MSQFDHFDETNYPREKSQFSQIIEQAISRRNFIKSSLVTGLSALAAPHSLFGAGGKSSSSSSLLGFKPVTANDRDTITVPEGYQWETLISWGDPILPNGTPFNQSNRGTPASQSRAFGDNNDGMSIFKINHHHAIMVVNNEYTNLEWLYKDGKVKVLDDVKKAKMAHGISVFEIREKQGRWKVVDGKFNRRITADSLMEITGVAKGHPLLITQEDMSGTQSKGTWNNCGNGETPWGTYLSCEENFNGYFASSDPNLKTTPDQDRYGIGLKDWGYSWYRYDKRFDISKEPNEPNRAGYVVEIDPFDPDSIPQKKTSLGRFKHENAEVVIAQNGQVVVYMGDDERGEYLYKFISEGRYNPKNQKRNRDLLDQGTLYVAKFGEANNHLQGQGEWIELSLGKNGLTPENGFKSQAEIHIFTRQAADIVGATTMDRPEWVAVNPKKMEVFCALTNNKNRGKKTNRGGIEQIVGGPNPRAVNHYGQIVRWVPEKDHTSNKFSWNLFVMAGNPLVKDGLYAGSNNIHPDNMFNSPDGIKFDSEGRLWIQTDGKYSNQGDFEGMGNNQMLCADPHTSEIRRFMVGPVACEITGTSWSPDQKTMFVGIQHPGEEKQNSHFPDGGNSVPRSSIVAIWKKDQQPIGS